MPLNEWCGYNHFPALLLKYIKCTRRLDRGQFPPTTNQNHTLRNVIPGCNQQRQSSPIYNATSLNITQTISLPSYWPRALFGVSEYVVLTGRGCVCRLLHDAEAGFASRSGVSSVSLEKSSQDQDVIMQVDWDFKNMSIRIHVYKSLRYAETNPTIYCWGLALSLGRGPPARRPARSRHIQIGLSLSL